MGSRLSCLVPGQPRHLAVCLSWICWSQRGHAWRNFSRAHWSPNGCERLGKHSPECVLGCSYWPTVRGEGQTWTLKGTQWPHRLNEGSLWGVWSSFLPATTSRASVPLGSCLSAYLQGTLWLMLEHPPFNEWWTRNAYPVYVWVRESRRWRGSIWTSNLDVRVPSSWFWKALLGIQAFSFHPTPTPNFHPLAEKLPSFFFFKEIKYRQNLIEALPITCPELKDFWKAGGSWRHLLL